MSCITRPVTPSIRRLISARNCLSVRSPGLFAHGRHYSQPAYAEVREVEQEPDTTPSVQRPGNTVASEGSSNRNTFSAPTSTFRPLEERLAEVTRDINAAQLHLANLFPDLSFPPELAQRALTHPSHILAATQGNSARLSFLGRRVLKTYLFAYLQSSERSRTYNFEELAAKALRTDFLGEIIGAQWGIGRAMVWQPSKKIKDVDMTNLASFKGTGLAKASGSTVEAIMGAVYHHWGGVVALKFFHTRVLPLLSSAGGLPKAFHADIFSKQKMYGGGKAKAPLLSSKS